MINAIIFFIGQDVVNRKHFTTAPGFKLYLYLTANGGPEQVKVSETRLVT